MAIIHILKDGTRVDDIRGRVVKISDAAPFYELLHSMNKEARHSDGGTERKEEARPCRTAETLYT